MGHDGTWKDRFLHIYSGLRKNHINSTYEYLYYVFSPGKAVHFENFKIDQLILEMYYSNNNFWILNWLSNTSYHIDGNRCRRPDSEFLELWIVVAVVMGLFPSEENAFKRRWSKIAQISKVNVRVYAFSKSNRSILGPVWNAFSSS